MISIKKIIPLFIFSILFIPSFSFGFSYKIPGWNEDGQSSFTYSYKHNDNGKTYVIASSVKIPSFSNVGNIKASIDSWIDSGIGVYELEHDKTTGEITKVTELVKEENQIVLSMLTSSDYTRLPISPIRPDGTQIYNLSTGETFRYNPNSRSYQVTKGNQTTFVDPANINKNSSGDAKKLYDFTQTDAYKNEQTQSYQGLEKMVNDSGACIVWDRKSWSEGLLPATGATLGNCFEQILYFVLYLISWLVGFAGSLFNLVFTKTVVEMSSWVGQVGAIDIAWRTMRDLANISFIFILLYLAISTILGLDEHGIKHTLSKLIIVAILINFSLFFTKVFIDASNIVAINFYNQINPVLEEDASGVGNNRGERLGMGDVFMSVFQLQTIYKPYSASQNFNEGAEEFASGNKTLSVFFAGAIFLMLVFALLLASIMVFIKRFIILILVMVFAPVAFAGSILHATEHHLTGEWWRYLLKESIFAPIYMIMLWVVLQIITSIEFKNAIGFSNTGLGQAITNPSLESSAAVFLNFFVAGTALVAILIVAEHMGVAGANGAMSSFQGIMGGIKGGALFTAKAAYDNTIGHRIRSYIEKEKSQGLYARAEGTGVGFASKWLARGTLFAGQKLSAGFDEKLKKEMEYRKMADHEFHNDPQRILERTLAGARDAINNKKHSPSMQLGDMGNDALTNEQHATQKLMLEKALEGATGKEKAAIEFALDRYYTNSEHARVSEDQKISIAQIERDKVLPFHRQEFERLFNSADGSTGIARTAAFKELENFFGSLGDRQKGQLLSTVSIDLQQKLSGNKDFQKIAERKIDNYNVLDQIQRGALATEAIKELAGKRGFSAIGRLELLEAYNKDKNNTAIIAELKKQFDKLGIEGSNIEEMVSKYEDTSTGYKSADETFKKGNLERFYKDIERIKETVKNLTKSQSNQSAEPRSDIEEQMRSGT